MIQNIDKGRPEYTLWLPEWQKARDVVFGGEFMVKKGPRRETYLPRLKGQSNDDYESYIRRGSFYEASMRTIGAYSGMVFRIPPEINLPSSIADYETACDGGSCSLAEFDNIVLQQEAAIGWYGVMLDFPAQGTMGPPWASLYHAESILDWEYGVYQDGNETKTGLVYVRLLEESDKRGTGDDRFTFTRVRRVRELMLENGVYIQRLWQQDEKKEWFETQIEPRMKGNKPIPFIPFVLPGTNPQPSKMMALINANLQHYEKEVDHGYGLHFTALPQPWGTGIDEKDVPKKRGPAEFWLSSNPDAQFGMLTLSGGDMDALGMKIKAIEDRMAILGARLLENSRTGIEAAETARIRQSGETSALSSMVDNVDDVMMKVLDMALRMTGGSGEIVHRLNRDFMDTTMTPEQMTALIGGYQSGIMPPMAVYEALKAGEQLPEGMDFDTWDENRLSA